MQLVKFVIFGILALILLFLLAIGSSVGYTVFLEMTRYTADSDQEYGIYAYWIWIVLATLFVFVLTLLLRMLAVKKFDAEANTANMIAFVIFTVSIMGIVATAVGIGVGVARFMSGGI